MLHALAVFHVHLERLAAFLASMEKLSWSPNNVLGFLIISVEQKRSSLGVAEMKVRLGHSSSHSKDIMWPCVQPAPTEAMFCPSKLQRFKDLSVRDGKANV